MSSSRHHIPFPRTFLSLNTAVKKTNNGNIVAASPESELPAHGFLSNRSTTVPRHSSISSVTSVDSVASTASTITPSESPSSPVSAATATTFLALNTKYATPPTSAKEMSGEKSAFLSNRA